MKWAFALLALALSVTSAHAQDESTTSVPVPAGASYLLADGRIALHGSHAMAPLIDALDAKFSEVHPGFRFAPVLKGSNTAMPALIAGATPIGFAIGEASQADQRAFRAVHKHDPTNIRIGYAGYGPRTGGMIPPSVHVHKTNPLRGLTMAQLAGIFTSGAPGGDLNNWAQLGVGGGWETRRIHLYGLRDDGAFATTMRLTRLGGLPFAGHYEPLADDAAVLKAVASDPYGIGILDWMPSAGLSDLTRIVALAADSSKPFVLPERADVARGAYPLTPSINLYIDRAPNKPIEPFVKAYLEMVLSNDGQAIIARFTDGEKGFLPLSPGDLGQERAKLKE